MLKYQTKILELLEDNKEKKCKSVIALIKDIPLTEPKRQNTYILDKDNQVFAVFCYYHKQWELVSETKYGVKASTKTGLNTMCKEGTNSWTRQQKIAKIAETRLLDAVISGEVAKDDAEDVKHNIERARTSIVVSQAKGYSLTEIKKMMN